MFSVINLEAADVLYVIQLAQWIIFSRKYGFYFKHIFFAYSIEAIFLLK